MRLAKWAFGLVIALGLVAGVTPLAVRWYAIHWLEQQGYDAAIKKLKMNFIFGEIKILGLDIRNPDRRGISLYELDVDMALSHLLQRRWVVKQLKIDTIDVDIHGRPEGLEVAGFMLSDKAVDPDGEAWSIDVQRVVVGNLNICHRRDEPADGPLHECLRADQLSLSNVAYQYGPFGWRLGVESNAWLSLSKVYFRDQFTGRALVYLDSAQFTGFDLGPRHARAKQVELTSFHVIEQPSDAQLDADHLYLTRVGRLLVNDFNLRADSPRKIRIGAFEVVSLRQALYQSEDLVPARVRDVLSYLPTRGRAASLARGERSFALEIDRTRITDGAIAWVDTEVVPTVQQKVTELSLQMGHFDSGNPQLPTPLAMSAKLEPRGQIQVQGEVYPFAEPVELVLEGFVQAWDLANVSAYTEDWLGQRVERGWLSAKFGLELSKGDMDLESQIWLNDFEFAASSRANGNAALSKAVNRLQDDNQAIEVNLPLRKDMSVVDDSLPVALGRALREALLKMQNKSARSHDVARQSAVGAHEPFRSSANEPAFAYRMTARQPPPVAREPLAPGDGAAFR